MQGVDEEEIDVRPFFSERLSDRLRNGWVVFTLYGDQHFVSCRGIPIPDEADVTLAILPPSGQRVSVEHELR